MAPLVGTPSEQLPDVLATGSTDVSFAFISMSTREPDGRDAEYLEWHSLDHRPEQHRLAGLRQSLRLVSTPACRAARAASTPEYDAADHVMTYLFDDPVATGERLGEAMRQRWASGDVQGLLAAPFFTLVPFEWARRLPGGATASEAGA